MTTIWKLFLLAMMGEQKDFSSPLPVPPVRNTVIDPALVPPDPEGGEDDNAGY